MSNNSIFPGQEKTVADLLSDKEEASLRELKSEYQKKLSEYSRLEKLTNEGTRGVVDSLAGKNHYAGKNIRLSSGTTGYVTQQGVFKPYPEGSGAKEIQGVNGCPTSVADVAIEGDFEPTLGSVVPTTPALIVGSTMKIGQVCGDWDRNVQVVQNNDRKASFVDIHTYTPSSDNPLVYQSDIDVTNKLAYAACRQRALDLGANAFGIGYFNGKQNGIKCAVGELPSNINTQNSSVEVAGFEYENHAPVSRFGLANDSTGLTTFGEGDRKLWSPVSNPKCVSNAGGSLINQIEATYGSNCNGKTNQIDQVAVAAVDVGKELSKGNQNAQGCVIM